MRCFGLSCCRNKCQWLGAEQSGWVYNALQIRGTLGKLEGYGSQLIVPVERSRSKERKPTVHAEMFN